MLARLIFIAILCFPFLISAVTDPRPISYPYMSYEDSSYKIKSLNDGRHWYICFNDKSFIHDPECPCHNRAKYVSYELDDKNQIITNSRRIIERIPAYDEFDK